MAARKGSDFAGLSVAITTPFLNGQVDYDRLREQVEFQIAAGTTGIVPVGTTGESPTLSHDETRSCHYRSDPVRCRTCQKSWPVLAAIALPKRFD